jgi:hypothetical protein
MNKIAVLKNLKIAVIHLLLFSNFAFSQGGWMRKYDLGRPGTVITSILNGNNCYWANAISLDTNYLPVYSIGTSYLKLDLTGQVIEEYSIFNGDSSIMAWPNDLIGIGSAKLANIVHLGKYGEGKLMGGILSFDTISTTFSLLRIPTDTIYQSARPSALSVTDESFFLLSDNYYNPNQGTQFDKIRSSLICISRNTNQVVWTKRLPGTIDSTSRVFMGNIEVVDDSLCLLGYNSEIADGQNPSQGSSIIKKIDTDGHELWSYTSPPSSKEWLLAHLHQNNDKSIVYAVNAFVDKVNTAGHYTYLYRGKIVKVDTLGSRLWERDWGPAKLGDYPFQAMLVNDDESIIACGVGYDFNYTDSIENGEQGYITKTTSNGDSLWSRHYVIRNQQYHWHNFMDIEATNDGGYILCGRSAIDGPVFPDEQFTAMAWVVKTDSMGCVVPGCHLVGVEEKTKQRPKVMVYPNPAHDYLAVFVPASTSNQALQIQLINLEGKVVLEDQFTQSDATYLLELKNISAGLYVLKVLQNGDLLQAEKVVVE